MRQLQCRELLHAFWSPQGGGADSPPAIRPLPAARRGPEALKYIGGSIAAPVSLRERHRDERVGRRRRRRSSSFSALTRCCRRCPTACPMPPRRSRRSSGRWVERLNKHGADKQLGERRKHVRFRVHSLLSSSLCAFVQSWCLLCADASTESALCELARGAASVI